MTDLQPCFPGQDFNTGQCSKLHISQKGSNEYIINKSFLAILLDTHNYEGHICIAQDNAISFAYLLGS